MSCGRGEDRRPPASATHAISPPWVQVDVGDLGRLASSWQSTAGFWYTGDLNYDSLVNVADLGLLASNWQVGVSASSAGGLTFDEALAASGLPAASVPEPAAAALVSLELAVGCQRGAQTRRHPYLQNRFTLLRRGPFRYTPE